MDDLMLTYSQLMLLFLAQIWIVTWNMQVVYQCLGIVVFAHWVDFFLVFSTNFLFEVEYVIHLAESEYWKSE